LEARNLEGKDKDGLSDPYFVLDCQGKTYTSKVIKDSLDPKWEEPAFEVFVSALLEFVTDTPLILVAT
jgi:Ca2+-dependent lipid-binding protein